MSRSHTFSHCCCINFAQQRRSFSGVFAGKYGLITLRDLFRWAERYRRSPICHQFHDWEQQLAEDGTVYVIPHDSGFMIINDTRSTHYFSL